MRTTWLAYNRRADIILQPRDVQSVKDYPNDVTYARLLWQRPMPSLKRIQKADKLTTAQTSASASSAATGN
jgi:hypothetical protein